MITETVGPSKLGVERGLSAEEVRDDQIKSSTGEVGSMTPETREKCLDVRSKLESMIRRRDAVAVGYMVDLMRFNFGMNYPEIFQVVHELIGVDQATWDALLEEADENVLD